RRCIIASTMGLALFAGFHTQQLSSPGKSVSSVSIGVKPFNQQLATNNQQPPNTPPPSPPAPLKSPRGPARHNDRAWFDPRKPIYEREIKAPMLAVIDEVNHALADFAPDHVRQPQKAMMRIYRDTRFAADKRPYKTNVAAWWVRAGLEKT